MKVPRRDLLAAAALAAVVQVELALRRGVPPEARLISSLAALTVLTLALGRRHPLAPAVAIVCASVADAAAGGVLIGGLHAALAAVVAACFVLGLASASPARVVAGTGFASAGMTLANQLEPSIAYSVLDDLVFFALLLGGPATVGHLLRRRAGLVAELAARSGALRAAQAQEAAAVAAEERARLAIAVHTAVAHRIGEISLQAAGAERIAAQEPARALAALARIEATARASLDDIRDAIGVLRQGDEALALAPHTERRGPLPGPWAPAAERPPAAVGAPPHAARKWLGRHSDVLIAAAVGAAIAVETLTSSRLSGPAAANLAGALAIAAPLAFRRRAPVAAAAATLAAAGLQSLALTPVALLVTPIVLLLLPAYSVAAHAGRRAAIAGLLICVAGTLAIEPSPPTALLGVLSWVAGRAVRDRSRRAEELHDLNARLERAVDARRARARGEERLRVARELHDAVAHGMTVVVLQAGAAQRVWQEAPSAARDAICTVAEVARATLAELRVTLGGGGDAGAPAPPDGLGKLLNRVRAVGLDVAYVREGLGEPLVGEPAHVVFCVVQEALTNAARHAGQTRVTVRVHRGRDRVEVDVVDRGRDPRGAGAGTVAGAGTGTGLRGMAERVAGCGGELRAGPAGEGFGVHALIPLTEGPA